MASEDLISALYPPPPPYVKFFTGENLEKLESFEGDFNENNITGELKFLVPPKPPAGNHYRGYGNIWSFEDKLPSLKNSNWDQLYKIDDDKITSENKISELHKLTDSLLLNFLELVGIISINPLLFEPKINLISLILININHLLNTYRPHQSRESLIMLLKSKIDEKNTEIENIDKVALEIKEKIKKLKCNMNLDVVHQDSHSLNEVSKDDIVKQILTELTNADSI